MILLLAIAAILTALLIPWLQEAAEKWAYRRDVTK